MVEAKARVTRKPHSCPEGEPACQHEEQTGDRTDDHGPDKVSGLALVAATRGEHNPHRQGSREGHRRNDSGEMARTFLNHGHQDDNQH